MAIGATATSGLPVSYAVSGPATLVGDVLTVTGPGDVTLDAWQVGNDASWQPSDVVHVFIAGAPLPVIIGGGIIGGVTAEEEFQSAMLLAGLTGDDASAAAMPYQDGVSNLLKYAFGMNLQGVDHKTMTVGGDHGLPLITMLPNGNQGVFRYEFVRRTNSAIIYQAQMSTDLSISSWSSLSSEPTVEPINDEWERVIYEEPINLQTTPKCFGRVLIEIP